MSYDLSLFKAVEGIAPADLAMLEDEARPLLDPADMARTAKALQAHTPSFHTFERDGYIELTDLDDNDENAGTAIQISFEATMVNINMPYWHKGAEAVAAFAALNAYLKIIHAEMGLLIHNPQSDSYVDAATGLSPDEVGHYEEGVDIVRTSAANPPYVKPWWKFW